MLHSSRFLRALGGPKVARLPFSSIQQADLAFFTNLLSTSDVLTESDTLQKYNTDWLKTLSGKSSCCLRPRTTAEVSSILQYCSEKHLAVVPQGGNTGLVGGATPVFDEIILSLEKMNKTLSVDAQSGTAVFESGKILEQANAELNEQGLMFPLDLGAKGSCQIGGNIATNAGGLRILRYGNLHGSVLGLEFVKGSGEVVDVLSLNKKDNTGLDLKQLLIGSEGILGVITKASVQCPPLSPAKHVVLLGVPSYQHAVQTFQRARLELGEILSAFEFFDAGSVAGVEQNLNLTIPEFLPGKFGVLVETSGSNAEHDHEKLMEFLANGEDMDGTIANSGTQIDYFWRLREDIPDAMMRDGVLYAYDVTLPDISRLYDIVDKSREFLGKAGLYKEDGSAALSRVVGYGHMGDGNLHINLTGKSWSAEVLEKYEPWLWQLVHDMEGSISAEHGIGSCKTDVIHHSKSTPALKLMLDIKTVFDPSGILNPYKVVCPQAVEGSWPQGRREEWGRLVGTRAAAGGVRAAC